MRHIYTYTTLSLLLGCSGSGFSAGSSNLDAETTTQADSGADSFSAMRGNSDSGNNGSGGQSPQMDSGLIEVDSGGKSDSGGMQNSGGNVGDGGRPNDMDGGSNTSGSGGVATGGSGGNEMDSGNGGSGGECQPKNCLDIAFDLTGNTEEKACGVVDNGCRNLIDCGGCDTTECGGDRISINQDQVIPLESIDNICGTSCKRVLTDICGKMNTEQPYTYYCRSSNSEIQAEEEGCVSSGMTRYICCPFK